MRLYFDIAFYTGISKEHKLPSFAEISIQFKRLQTYNLTKFDFELCINDMIKELEQIRKLGLKKFKDNDIKVKKLLAERKKNK